MSFVREQHNQQQQQSQKFLILENTELQFERIQNGQVNWKPLRSIRGDAQDAAEEFDLTNFTGRLVVRQRQGNKISLLVGSSLEDVVISTKDPQKAGATRSTENSSLVMADDSAQHSAKNYQNDDEIIYERNRRYEKDTVAAPQEPSTRFPWPFFAAFSRTKPPNTEPASTAKATETYSRAIQVRDDDDDDSVGHTKRGPGSPLHDLCSHPTVTLTELQNCLQQYPQAPFVTNSRGQSCLHLLTDNAALWYATDLSESPLQLLFTLVKHNPLALAMEDIQHQLPLLSILHQWVHEQYSTRPAEQKGSKTLLEKFVQRGVMVGSGIQRAIGQASLLNNNDIDDRSENTTSLVATSTAISVKFPQAQVSQAVELALSVLSVGFTTPVPSHAWPEQQDMKTMVCRRIATHTPQFLPTMLLVEPTDMRTQLLSSPFLQRLLLEPATVEASWLVTLMRKKGLSCRRAVDYLELVSDVSLEDYCGSLETDVTTERLLYKEHRTQLFDKIGDIGGLIPSLFVLDEKEMERAAATPALWHAMHQCLKRPFIIGIVLVDFVLHLTLTLSFRASVLVVNDGAFGGGIPTRVVTSITCFYVMRKVSEAISLWNISKTVMRHYMLDMWNLFDMLCIVMVILANALGNNATVNNEIFNSIVLALLYLKILAFLKAVNMQMATFILALTRIVRDIRFFVVVLIVFLLMFGDIMSLIFVTNEQLCQDESDPSEDFCSGKQVDAYLRMYGVLIGDFELNDYRGSQAVVTVFIIFTVIGVIILLNMLIAIVSESYERATTESRSLFGRARVGFIAEHIALEQFLQPGTNPVKGILRTHDTRGIVVFFARIFRWFVLIALLGTAIFAAIFLVAQAIGTITGNTSVLIMLFLIAMAWVLIVGLWVIVHFLFFGVVFEGKISIPVVSTVIGLIDKLMRISLTFFRNRAFGNFVSGEEDGDEWTGRMAHIEKMLERHLMESEQKLSSLIVSTAKNISEENSKMLTALAKG